LTPQNPGNEAATWLMPLSQVSYSASLPRLTRLETVRVTGSWSDGDGAFIWKNSVLNAVFNPVVFARYGACSLAMAGSPVALETCSMQVAQRRM
jgi:hypothetical protein